MTNDSINKTNHSLSLSDDSKSKYNGSKNITTDSKNAINYLLHIKISYLNIIFKL
jgi:hypothetical protein